MIPIGDKFVKAVATQNAPTEGMPTSRGPLGSDYGEAEAFITQVVKLEVIKPTELQQLLSTFTKAPQGITAFDATQTIVIRDYASNVRRMMEVIKSVDVKPKEPDYHLEAIPIKYGKVIDLYNTMQALVGGSGGTGAGNAHRLSIRRSGIAQPIWRRQQLWWRRWLRRLRRRWVWDSSSYGRSVRGLWRGRLLSL